MPTAAAAAPTVHRIEIRPRPERDDPRGAGLREQARAAGLDIGPVRSAKVYLIEGEIDRAQLSRITERLLRDPVAEVAQVGAGEARGACVEVHPLPGVTDPVAQSVGEAIKRLTGLVVRVSTGTRYDIEACDPGIAREAVTRTVANPLIHAVHAEPYHPESLPRGSPREASLIHVPIRNLTDAELARLSREAHLFLSVPEMAAIRAHYQTLGREPTDIELETLAQTWSEHCVHKTLKSTVRYRSDGEDVIDWFGRPGHRVEGDGTVVISNLLKSTVASATHELIAAGVDWTLSVFVDNAGVIAFDEANAVCVKVETHNHPSALEPYGGAATGIGGCIRDVMGTGLGAKPIASTDVFCVAPPETSPPAGALHPRRVLTQVVAGVRDYGNRMGIPTINGAVYFDERFVGNPLVFCGCVGLMPLDRIRGGAREGDLIVALGGRTGRDGIHGATFSSAELTDTHADEFSHAVQIGNAIEEKRTLDAILRARDEHGRPLFHAITDCGAGGFSSAIGEMGRALGAEVHLDRAPLKYEGLTYTEIWISEAQERMVLAVASEDLAALQRICEEEAVELSVLGRFGTPGRELVLRHRDKVVGRLSMDFLHEGLPMPTREASWSPPRIRRISRGPAPIPDVLERLLSHPNIASKHWIIRQYDHEVQGNAVLKPLVGPMGRGPGDASVIEPVPGSGRGLAIACGLQPRIGDPEIGGDPYQMALAGIDECVRNLVCVGADPGRIAILDNFCWPGCDDPASMGLLVRAAEGCYDGAKAYRTPFVSGKDSLNNQFTTEEGRTIRIPPTLLITGLGIVHDIGRAVSMDAKRRGSVLLLAGSFQRETGGSMAEAVVGACSGRLPRVDLRNGPRTAERIAGLIESGRVLAAHDVSDGGVLVAIAEMLIAGSSGGAPLGAMIDLDALDASPFEAAFAESPSCYVLEIGASDAEGVMADLGACVRIGVLTDTGRLEWPGVGLNEGVEALAAAWRGRLDW